MCDAKIPGVSLPFFKKLFELKDRLLREVTWNVDKTEEKVPDSESSRLWVFEIDDVDYIHIHSFQVMNLNSRNFRSESS